MSWAMLLKSWWLRCGRGRHGGVAGSMGTLDRATTRRIRRGIEARLGRRPARGTG